MSESVKQKSTKQKQYSPKKLYILSSVATVIFTQLIVILVRAVREYLPVFVRNAFLSGKGFGIFADNVVMLFSLYILFVFTRKYYSGTFSRLKGDESFKRCLFLFFALEKSLMVLVDKLTENFSYLMLRINVLSSGKFDEGTVGAKNLLTRFGYSFASVLAFIAVTVSLYYAFSRMVIKREKAPYKAFAAVYALLSLLSLGFTIGYNALLENTAACFFEGIQLLLCGAFTVFFFVKIADFPAKINGLWKKQYALIYIAVTLVLIPFIYNIYSGIG
ncbi:MAG: hypothetical protein IJL63_02180 [Clostridia bacterium]|nr:hypothetical protein [Clostridia bacterium]